VPRSRPPTHRLEPLAQIVVLPETEMQERVEEDQCLLGRSHSCGFDDASIGSERAEPVHVLGHIRPGGAHVMNHVALDPPGSTIQPRHVYARQVDAPHRDPVHNGSRNVAERGRQSQGVLYGASPHQMLANLVEAGPQIRVRVVAAPEAHQELRANGAGEVLIPATRVEGFGSREEAASLSKDSDRVHVYTM